jgi:hypothetical protein
LLKEDMRLYIDSRFRTPDSYSASDFTIELRESVDRPAKSKVRVFNLCVPFSWYTVETGINQHLYIAEKDVNNNQVVRVITLPVGIYDGPKLALNIAAGLNGAGLYVSGSTPTPYLVTYNDRTGRIQISLQVPGVWRLIPDSLLSQFTVSYPSGASVSSPHSFSRNLGLSASVAYSQSQAYVSEFVDLMAVKTIYLTSTSLGNLSNVGPRPGQRDVLCCVPVTVSYGYLVCDTDASQAEEWTDCSGQLLKRLSFQVRDAAGSVIDLHGLEISFCLAFDSE